jgi:cytochrome c
MKAAAIALLVALAGSGSAALGQGMELLRSKGCVGCHDAERTKVGPSLKDIRAKYGGDTSRAPQIVARMKDGKGHPKIAAPDADLTAAVQAAITAK